MGNKKIFWCSAPPQWEKTPSGDADFIVQMMASLQQHGVATEWIRGELKLDSETGFRDKKLYDESLNVDFSELIGNQQKWREYYLSRDKRGLNRAQAVKNIINYIIKNTPPGTEPVFHLTIRTPDTGYMIAPTDLQLFKDSGIKVVVTCHEYHLNKQCGREEFNNSALTYFKEADKVIFLNESCKREALQDAQQKKDTKFVTFKDLKEKASVSPIPVTVPSKDKETVEARLIRPPNILTFGNFRRHKGFEEACRAVKLLDQYKKSTKENHPLKNAKVIFAGSLNPTFPSVYGTILKTLRDYPDSIEVHPNPNKILHPNTKHIIGLETLIEWCETKRTDMLNLVKSQTFIESDELAKLSKRCKYAYKGDQTGMRDNASGIISTLAHGCITFCGSSFNTDKCYLPAGIYADAIDLDTTPGQRMAPGFPKAETLIDKIIHREIDQKAKPYDSQNKQTLKKWMNY
jgi:hypothetical protein